MRAVPGRMARRFPRNVVSMSLKKADHIMNPPVSVEVPIGRWSSPDSRWGQVRWAPANPGPTPNNRMSQIAINISRLSISEALTKILGIINMSTDNPAAPNNGPLLALLTTAHTDLTAANTAYEDARKTCAELKEIRDAKQLAMRVAVNNLAAFTEIATGGDAAKILSTGFDVKSEPVPPSPVGQILNVRVSFTGEPGKSTVTWKADPYADAYRVQCCQDPLNENEWVDIATVAEPKFTGNGAIPGKLCWYRAAGVNRLGQGLWSEPALRPVM